MLYSVFFFPHTRPIWTNLIGSWKRFRFFFFCWVCVCVLFCFVVFSRCCACVCVCFFSIHVLGVKTQEQVLCVCVWFLIFFFFGRREKREGKKQATLKKITKIFFFCYSVCFPLHTHTLPKEKRRVDAFVLLWVCFVHFPVYTCIPVYMYTVYIYIYLKRPSKRSS